MANDKATIHRSTLMVRSHAPPARARTNATARRGASRCSELRSRPHLTHSRPQINGIPRNTSIQRNPSQIVLQIVLTMCTGPHPLQKYKLSCLFQLVTHFTTSIVRDPGGGARLSHNQADRSYRRLGSKSGGDFRTLLIAPEQGTKAAIPVRSQTRAPGSTRNRRAGVLPLGGLRVKLDKLPNQIASIIENCLHFRIQHVR